MKNVPIKKKSDKYLGALAFCKFTIQLWVLAGKQREKSPNETEV